MILAVDIGNTNIVLGLHDGKTWIKTHRVRTKDSDAFSQIRELLKNTEVDRSVISSVVPSMTTRIVEIASEISKAKPLVISKKINTGLVQDSIPEELGADIICNLIAGHYYYPDCLVTVADFGTAFTTETVDEKGCVLGVTIAPGMMTSVKALYENTAQIPQICLDVPETVLGRDTVSAIRAGVFYGFAGQLSAIVKRIKDETKRNNLVIVTGGFSKYVKPYLDFECLADVNLTLEGARIACMIN